MGGTTPIRHPLQTRPSYPCGLCPTGADAGGVWGSAPGGLSASLSQDSGPPSGRVAHPCHGLLSPGWTAHASDGSSAAGRLPHGPGARPYGGDEPRSGLLRPASRTRVAHQGHPTRASPAPVASHPARVEPYALTRASEEPMHFVALSLDRTDGLDTRLSNRPAHLDFLKANRDRIKIGGPLL